MFFILSKVLYYILMPVAWLLLFLLLAVILRNPRQKRMCMATALGLYLLFTNPLIINELLLWWEVPAKPVNEVENYEVAVVLTGITHTNRKPHDRVYFTKGADRLMHTLMLYKQGKVKKILISGGSAKIVGEGLREADLLRQTLLLAEVPDEDIMIENRSRNTYENAVFSAAMMQEMGFTGRVLLVTSAFHMRRSAGCFEKQGIKFDTFSTDFYTYDRSEYSLDNTIIPQEKPFYYWYIFAHELLGYVIYRAIGYI